MTKLIKLNPDNFQKNQVKADLGIAENEFVIGFVGRLHLHKGPDVLVKTMKILLEELKNYLLIISMIIIRD